MKRPRRMMSRLVTEGQTVADVGCGPGFYTVPMAEAVGESGKVFAVDFDERALKNVQKKAARKGVQVETVQASIAALDHFEDRSLDFLFANLVLCCMEDHDGAVAEVKRVLKPDGTAYLSIARPLPITWDKKAVKKKEWREILEGFQVLKKNSTLMELRAVVALAS